MKRGTLTSWRAEEGINQDSKRKRVSEGTHLLEREERGTSQEREIK